MVATQMSELIDLLGLPSFQPPQHLDFAALGVIPLLFEHFFELVYRFGDLNFEHTSYTLLQSR